MYHTQYSADPKLGLLGKSHHFKGDDTHQATKPLVVAPWKPASRPRRTGAYLNFLRMSKNGKQPHVTERRK